MKIVKADHLVQQERGCLQARKAGQSRQGALSARGSLALGAPLPLALMLAVARSLQMRRQHAKTVSVAGPEGLRYARLVDTDVTGGERVCTIARLHAEDGLFLGNVCQVEQHAEECTQGAVTHNHLLTGVAGPDGRAEGHVDNPLQHRAATAARFFVGAWLLQLLHD